ncbi:MAG: S26 family signal peptidase, partial [Thermoplasmata archaeon]|nr:S26 family signal peptidase [Thermoplasmata archaeon]
VDEPPRLHLPRRRPVFYRARDSLYFEPLVALALVVLLLVGLYAYTQNWPPIYVVESDSMQHGSTDQLGLLNTGDLVLAQKIDPSHVQTYSNGLSSGYTTYGEFGDVILYEPNGLGGTPIIHRSIVYLQANGGGTFSAPSLAGLPCGGASNAVYRSSGSGGCGWSHIGGTLQLLNVGWRSLNVSIALGGLGSSSGFITLGDNNPITDQSAGLSGLVQSGWVLGVARGMIPWFGALKLALEGNAQEVPPQSWQFMGLAIIALVLAAFAVHYVLHREGVEDERRKEKEAEEAKAHAEVEALDGHPRRWNPLRAWRHHDEGSEESEAEAPPAPAGRGREPPTQVRHSGGLQGRPRPHVRRGSQKEESKHRGRETDKNDDDEEE